MNLAKSVQGERAMLDYDDEQPSAVPRRKDKQVAPTQNKTLFEEMIFRVIARQQSVSGLACFYGPSGYGKTFSALGVSHDTEAYYVEMGESWSRKTLVQRVARELGIRGYEKSSISDLMELVIERLSDEPNRPLIIDEADYLAKKGLIDIVREMLDKSDAVIILIGEERLPDKLKLFERSHNRVMDWVPAVPCGIADASLLSYINASGIEVSDDLLKLFVEKCHGCTRRIVTNLSRIPEIARNRNLNRVSLADWGSTPVFTGDAPKRRVL